MITTQSETARYWLEWRPVGCTCSRELRHDLRCGNRPIGWLGPGWVELVCDSAREASDRRRRRVGESDVAPASENAPRLREAPFQPQISFALIP